MNDQIFFQDSDAIVTSSQFVHGGNHYPLDSIKSVVFFKEPLDIKGLLINAAIALAGLWGIFTFSTFGVIAGLIAVGVCGFNLYSGYNDINNPMYIVAVDFHTGESIYIKRRDLAWVKKLHDALRAAMSPVPQAPGTSRMVPPPPPPRPPVSWTPPPPPPKVQSGSVQCTKCGERSPSDTRFCIACGNPFTT